MAGNFDHLKAIRTDKIETSTCRIAHILPFTTHCEIEEVIAVDKSAGKLDVEGACERKVFRTPDNDQFR